MKNGLNKKYVIMLFVNTVILLLAYLILIRFFPLATLIGYTAVTAAVAFLYVIYNRGFTRKNLKCEDLPNTMSAEEKTAYIEDGKRRLERSKWVVTVIIPLILIYVYELMDIFVLPFFAELLGIAS
ncbi:MAG: hypothetical protein E7640_00265 [Ruminococcaceae bacterium]|nr:hypothetical protein [Oscillospiraceae bacterium]